MGYAPLFSVRRSVKARYSPAQRASRRNSDVIYNDVFLQRTSSATANSTATIRLCFSLRTGVISINRHRAGSIAICASYPSRRGLIRMQVRRITGTQSRDDGRHPAVRKYHKMPAMPAVKRRGRCTELRRESGKEPESHVAGENELCVYGLGEAMIKSGHEQALKEIGQSYCKTGKETGNDVSAQKWKQEKGEHRWFDERGKNHCDVEP